MKKPRLILILIVSFTTVLAACGKKQPEYSEAHAKEYFNNTYNFELPETSRVIMYTNENINNFKAKIFFEEKDLEYIKKELLNYFTLEWLPENEVTDDYNGFRYTENDIAVLKKRTEWLDFEFRNIETCYLNYMTGKKLPDGSVPKTVKNRVFVCKNDDGKYYLYIVIY